MTGYNKQRISPASILSFGGAGKSPMSVKAATTALQDRLPGEAISGQGKRMYEPRRSKIDKIYNLKFSQSQSVYVE